MKVIEFGRSKISDKGPCYVIAEIGHNHQGSLDNAKKMIAIAAGCGAQAVKFQKRDNKSLYTKAFYDRPYDNENSYGATYGEHREFLEFGRDEYAELKKYAAEQGVEFMSTAFDFKSADFLGGIGLDKLQDSLRRRDEPPASRIYSQIQKADVHLHRGRHNGRGPHGVRNRHKT